MLQWAITLWFAVSVSGHNHQVIPTKQISNKKNVTSLTISRLSKEAVRAPEHTTFNNRHEMAEQAEAAFRRAGITSDKMIVALLANGWHESRWNPKEITGNCVGFFQLSKGGLGAKLTFKQLQDLQVSIQYLSHTLDFQRWVSWCNAHPAATCGEMSSRFATQVERCAHRYVASRHATANRWFRGLKSR